MFLYHAIRAGMDMGIVNAGALPIYSDIPEDLLERVEDVVLNRRADAHRAPARQSPTTVKGQAAATAATTSPGASLPVGERLAHALVRRHRRLHRRGHRGGAPQAWPGRSR